MRFRFTIRDLLWLTLVVALVVGWWINHRKSLRLEADLVIANRRLSETEAVDAEVMRGMTQKNRELADALRYEELEQEKKAPDGTTYIGPIRH
jgi:hypothetical protein